MKKLVFALTLSALLVVLAACNQSTGQAGSGGSSAPLSTEMELLVGTFKLEGTDQAVTADQAKQLLPLWQTLQALSTSSTAATEEVNATVDQIKSTMTGSQMNKITALKLTQKDVLSIMSQTGVSPNGGSATTTPMQLGGLPSRGGSSQGGPGGVGGGPSGGGAPPSGGFPGGGFSTGGDPGLAGGPGGLSATPQAVRPNGMSSQVPPPLLNALIELLQKKIK